MSFQPHIPVFDALVLLAKPMLEITVHDLETNKISYINGQLSQRKVGDASLINRAELGQELAQISIKTSFDGRLLKSILVLLPDNRFLVCINLDITIFNQMQRLGQELSEHGTKNLSENLFKNDWQHKLALAIHAYLAQHSWDFNSLSRQQKKQLIEHLDTMGAFNQKNAASYISKSLNLSRATVFNYLRSWRNN